MLTFSIPYYTIVYGLILSLKCFSILVNYYSSEPQGSFKLEVILYLAKIQNSIIKNTVSKYQSQTYSFEPRGHQCCPCQTLQV